MEKTNQHASIFKRFFCMMCLALAAVFFCFTVNAQTAEVKLNKTSLTVYQTTISKLKLLNATGKVTWKSSNPEVATVSKNGKVQTFKAGKCTITAKYKKKTYKCKVKVKAVKLNTKALTLVRGRSSQLKLNRSTLKPVWTSSDTSVANVNKLTGYVQAVKPGTCTITAKYRKVTWECQVTVLSISEENLAVAYQANKANQGKILLAGSSSLDLWNSAPSAFAPYEIINTAISGSTVTQWISRYQTLITRYKPSAVVLYVGSNDIGAYGVDGMTNARNTRQLLQLIHSELKNTPIYYVSVIPCYVFGNEWYDISMSNWLTQVYCQKTDNVYYIDLAQYFVQEDGTPNRDLFKDQLHPNAEGYALWKKYVAKPVVQEIKTRAKKQTGK